jgi:hypothetical protein
VADNIAEFVKRRLDIFGHTNEESESVRIPQQTQVATQPVIGPTMPAPPPPLVDASPKKKARKL